MTDPAKASAPVGFRLYGETLKIYLTLAKRDRRKLGAYLRKVLEDVTTLIVYCEHNKIAPDTLLRSLPIAGASIAADADELTEALLRENPQTEPEPEA